MGAMHISEADLAAYQTKRSGIPEPANRVGTEPPLGALWAHPPHPFPRTPAKPHKYNAQKTLYSGDIYDSADEASHAKAST